MRTEILDMLTDQHLEIILNEIPQLTIGVVGDLFLDRYLDIDAALTERSLETGLDAYQVVGVRSYPGAAGTVINNLAALGVKKVCPISVIGDDGEGYELLRALNSLGPVDPVGILQEPSRRTPTYTKPMLQAVDQPPRELNRLDIKNRTRLLHRSEDWVVHKLDEAWKQVDALVVSDQVSEADCGVVTAKVREQLATLGEARPGRVILADSRDRIGHFRSVCLKPNQTECCRAIVAQASSLVRPGYDLPSCAQELAKRAGRPVFCTRGEQGILIVDPRSQPPKIMQVPAYPVARPIDIVGAGDSTNAGIVCALAAGADLEQAAAFGCLMASVTIQQIGVTGTATPEQIRQRWNDISRSR
jgi:rfaE bifunctional protein kinase chain/domain